MKSFGLIALLLLIGVIGNAQSKYKSPGKKETNILLKNNDFSFLYIITPNSEVFGFIGNNFQRLRIKFITVIKSPSSNTYNVFGKSMVKNTIDVFKGTIIITNIRLLKTISYGVDNEYKNKGIIAEGELFGTYSFAEDSVQTHAGKFTGIFETNFYIDKNKKVHYDNIDIDADGYSNNQFTGKWKSYKSGMIETCNWGDYRIPHSGDLDIGAGDFSPADKYLKYDWQSVRDYTTQNSTAHKKAKQTEEAQWWK